MPGLSEIRAEGRRLRDVFAETGAEIVETDALLSAEALLDLYGEDVRSRAYLTSDAIRGEQILRPDFTVPVVQMHVERGGGSGRYAYAGEVFRRQEEDPERRNEYCQAGFELFGGDRPEVAEAEVFATISDVLSGLELRIATGDIGILMAVVEGLRAAERRKAALRRHIWRPERFREILRQFASPQPPSGRLRRILEAQDPLAEMAPLAGLRSKDEIMFRINELREEVNSDPLDRDQVAAVEEVLELRGTSHGALPKLREIAQGVDGMDGAVDRFEARLEEFDRRGIDLRSLDFEACYGRTRLEYYDGFVFGFYAEGRPDLPPVATGGRYDTLARRLGDGRRIPAVGGVVRPDILLSLGGAP